jgi:hypothetical protein
VGTVAAALVVAALVEVARVVAARAVAAWVVAEAAMALRAVGAMEAMADASILSPGRRQSGSRPTDR